MITYKFGCFSLDLTDRCLMRNGRLLTIPDKLFDILALLVENHGRVVTKEELMLKIWGNSAVEDSNLTVSLSRIRKILREREPRKFIITIPRRGYRFVATVLSIQQNEFSSTLASTDVEFSDIGLRDCACLFVDAAAKEDSSSYLALRTRNSVMGTDYPLSFEKNPEASRAYLTGCYSWSRYTKESLEDATGHFEQAVQLDPDYLPAYAALMDCYLRLATRYFLLPNARGQHSVQEPMTTVGDRSCTSRGSLQFRHPWEITTATRERNRALQLGLHYPGIHQWHAACTFLLGSYHEAISKSDSAKLDDEQGLQLPNALRANSFNDSKLARAELLQISCMVARNQIEGGNFEAGYLMLRRWYTLGQWPELQDLSLELSADLLFTAGRLAGQLANCRQVPRGQIHAVSLLNAALGLFEQRGLRALAAECRSELGRCYDRQGLFDLSRTNFVAALEALPTDYTELRARTLLRLAFSEMKSGHLKDSLAILEDCRKMPLSSPFSASFFNIEMATTAGELAIAADSDEYFELASQHYREALLQTEAVGHHRRLAVLENNHGYLLLAFGRLDEAESRLLRARELFDHLGHQCPELDETFARLYMEMGQLELAESAIVRSVAALESSGEEALAESLRTQGRVLAKLQRYREASRVLDRAFQLSKRCGDTEGAGLALLIVIEEMSERLEADERLELAATVSSMLSSSQRISVLRRVEQSIKAVEKESRKLAARVDKTRKPHVM